MNEVVTEKGRATRLQTGFNPFSMAKNTKYQLLHDPGRCTTEMNFRTNTNNDPNDAVLAATESDVVTGKGHGSIH